MTEPFVSVVTPFYNTQAYLAECIESVLAQTYGNFEYVLLDNHSTDGSADIAARYAQRDSRIRLVRTARLLPQVENYNFALSLIGHESRYCKMAQADDFLYPRCLTEMVALAEAHPSVSLVSSYRMIEDTVDCVGLHARESIVPGERACRLHLLGKAYLFGSPSTVLYRSEDVRARTPFFELGRFHEDTETAFELLENRDFGFVHQVLSFSRRNADSIMGSAKSLHPYALDHFIIFKRFGRKFLDDEDYARCEREVTAQYYYGLAGRWIDDGFRMADNKFWSYQRRGLATVNARVEPKLLARFAAELGARRALSPLTLVRDWRAAVQRQRNQNRNG